MTDLNKEREAFLNTFQYYKGRRDIIFSYEHELFMTRSNNPSEIAQKEISNMNSRWDAWLRCAKHRDAELEKAKAQAVPEHAEIYIGKGLFALVDWEDFDAVKAFKWNPTSLDKRTQWAWAYERNGGKDKRSRVAMHNLIMKPKSGLVVDHINGIGLDNRRANLRVVTPQQNSFNTFPRKGTSIYKGVCFEDETGMWRAYISKDGKRKWLGRFITEIQAAMAYDNAAKDLFGEYAKLNVVEASESGA
ncbi:HNH endonuclease [Acinetobacter baumannii]|nr:HNH endonuclease [Acinetobacter baumannii]MBF6951916.1 HNH endonuclease [Acinetobacter baumannii]MDC3964267.1 HNH endonuclease [Acinetobacter baumannii]MDC4012813.1 HNH endonuclease [Acinetobacter baumannii]MDC4106813.1 HNH endonuclease [Acinetobacter baumannii]